MPSDDEDDDFEAGTALLPTHVDNTTTPPTKPAPKSANSRIGDVWDVREELFNIGDSDDEEEHRPATSSYHHSQPETGSLPSTPKIIVTSSD